MGKLKYVNKVLEPLNAVICQFLTLEKPIKNACLSELFPLLPGRVSAFFRSSHCYRHINRYFS